MSKSQSSLIQFPSFEASSAVRAHARISAGAHRSESGERLPSAQPRRWIAVVLGVGSLLLTWGCGQGPKVDPGAKASPGDCVPTTCAAVDATCGTIPDQCGGMLDCGTCAAPATCEGGGVANQCGCTPKTCLSANANCGSLSDGCGQILECGTCVAPAVCGAENQCGMPPTIRIVEATYGRACSDEGEGGLNAESVMEQEGGSMVGLSATGNVTTIVARQCDGKPTCSILVHNETFGDPFPGCPKDFRAVWMCGNVQQMTSHESVSFEGYLVDLTCAPQ